MQINISETACVPIVGFGTSVNGPPAVSKSKAPPRLEVGTVFRKFWSVFLKEHGASLSNEQARAVKDIVFCRTPAMGGHQEMCKECGYAHQVYHSCGNRHCTKCGFLSKAQWKKDRQAEILPIEYFHLVFKVPHAIEEIAYQHRRLLFNLMLGAAAETLRTITEKKSYLGAHVGFILQLQTSSEMLMFHPHIHALVSGGGLSLDGKRWVSGRDGFLPRRVLSRLFQAFVLDGLRIAFKAGKLTFSNAAAPLRAAAAFELFLEDASHGDWDVYIDHPIAGPEQVLSYMSRHAQNVAISPDRLVAIKDDRVYFNRKDHRLGDSLRTTSLLGKEFVRRVLMHVSPRGFQCIRYYGFLARRNKEQLAQCRRLLCMPAIEQTAAIKPRGGYRALFEELTGRPLGQCPKCKQGQMVIVAILPKIMGRQCSSP
jgi:hypothetical protein